ncbi:hypothetical protein PAN31117_03146 [Pandoraea anapnoica]|uniref:Uncharacterized protein n=1 Tax=Pandoraea anapnoica TaxID=2508301 RepID=A0A5E5A7X5_9BURK|nr:hypothetical protein [Pandoraea anapnoica]VVE68912.1 hypothetical protein PAN31117_03146 [Pandoraea anapnoica]
MKSWFGLPVVLWACVAGTLVVVGVIATRSVFELSASDWAAWVQAIGSICAIGIAIYVPWRQRRIEGEARRREPLITLRLLFDLVREDLAALSIAATGTHNRMFVRGIGEWAAFKDKVGAVRAFSWERLLDPMAIRALLSLQRIALELDMHLNILGSASESDRIQILMDEREAIDRLVVEFELAQAQLGTVLDGAGIDR